MTHTSILDAPRLILRADACKALGGISKSTLLRLEASEDFPPVIEIGPRLRGYDVALFADYLRSRRTGRVDREATAAATAALAKRRTERAAWVATSGHAADDDTPEVA